MLSNFIKINSTVIAAIFKKAFIYVLVNNFKQKYSKQILTLPVPIPDEESKLT